jgi:type I restriction enzyme S subunit
VQTGPFGSQLHASDYVAAGVPSIMPVNIGDNRVVEDGIARVREADAVRLSRYRVRPGDIVYSRRGDVERRALIREREAGWLCGTGCLRIRLGDGPVDAKYVSYYLGHPEVRSWIVRHAQGATMPNLNTSILSNLPLVVPPLATQRRIAEILGALDDKIELNRRMSETLESMALSLFKSWFVDFEPVRAKSEGRHTGLSPSLTDLLPDQLGDSELGRIPAGWEVTTIGGIANVIDCLHSKKPERRGTGRPLLQLGDIRDDGLLDLRDPYLIGGEDYERWTSRMEASPGDCVITNVGRVGAVAQIPAGVRAALGRNMTGIRCEASFPFPTFLLEALLSDAMRDEIIRRTDTGTILDALNVRNIPSLRIVRPRDHRILKAYEDVARPLRARMEQLIAQSRTLGAVRDALLPKLVAGELRVGRMVVTDGGATK